MERLNSIIGLSESAGDARFLLGISGAPGAGKTTLAKGLVALINSVNPEANAAYLPMDGFHLSRSQLEHRGLLQRKGAPETFDVDGFVALLLRAKVRRGRELFAPDYDRDLHEPVAARLSISAASRIVVVEGNYLGLDINQGWASVADTLDELWYLETSSAVRNERLESRQKLAGKSAIEAAEWVARVDAPNARLIESSRNRAQTIVTSDDFNLSWQRG